MYRNTVACVLKINPAGSGASNVSAWSAGAPTLTVFVLCDTGDKMSNTDPTAGGLGVDMCSMSGLTFSCGSVCVADGAVRGTYAWACRV